MLIAFGAVIFGVAVFLSRDARRLWRGERLRYLPLYARFYEVTHRSFAVMVAVIASFGAICLLAGAAGVLWDELPSFAGGVVLGLIVLMLGLIALGGVLEATSRPRFLIPPPHRPKPQSAAGKRRRRT